MHRQDQFFLDALLGMTKPKRVVELGTGVGVTTYQLAVTAALWDGKVFSIDHVDCREWAACGHAQYVFLQINILESAHPALIRLISDGGESFLLLVDNGDKMRELELYAEYVKPGGVVVVHDWESEVPPDKAVSLMSGMGFMPLLWDLATGERSNFRAWRRA